MTSSGDGRGRRLQAIYRRVDGAVFAVEAGIVTAATGLMTLFIFLDLTFSFTNGIRIKLFPSRKALAAGAVAAGLPTSRWVALALSMALVAGLVAAGVWSHPRLRRGPIWHRMVATLGGLTAALGAVALLVLAHPRWICLALVGLGAAYSWVRLVRATGRRSSATRGYAIWLVAVGLLGWFSWHVPDRISSWAQPYALFLLLWTGFIGASMATSQGRHLRIDAVRKAVPRRFLGAYNLVSYWVAAGFTAVFAYLAFKYTAARMGTAYTAGEIPDWLKVLAIPISLLLISLRFAVRGALAALGFEEAVVGEVILPAAERHTDRDQADGDGVTGGGS